MAAINKPVQIRIRISEDDEKLLCELGKTVLSVTDVASYLLKASIDCMRENTGRVPFPPKFHVQDEAPFSATRFNEPKTTKK